MTEVLEPEVVKRGRGRPPKVIDIAGVRTLPERITKINDYHDRARAAAECTAMYVVLCGIELLAARAQIKHGHWDKWVADSCAFNRITAWRYMEIASRKIKQASNVSALKHLADGQMPYLLPPEQRKLLVKAVKDSCDGETAQQLYLEYGLTKASRTFDHIGGNADLRAWLAKQHPECKAKRIEDCPKAIRNEYAAWCDDQDAEKATRLQANPAASKDDLKQIHYRLTWDELVKGMREFVMQQNGHAYVLPAALDAGLESLGDCLRKLRDDRKKMHG